MNTIQQNLAIKKLIGVTLLEILLVIAIGSSFILFAIRQYQLYQAQQYALQLRYNAETLLEALSYYYQANCAAGSGRTLSQTPLPSVYDDSGKLYTDLTKGFLPGNWQPINPLVDNAATNKGYFVQFNNRSAGNRNINVCYSYWSTSGTAGTQGCSPAQAISNAPIILWQEQLAIKMKNPAQTLGYLGLSGADCAVDSLTSGAPVDCSNTSTTGQPNYLVWQRLPSFASPTLTGDQWINQPIQKSFIQQYTHDPMYELYLQGTGSTTFNYLCGG